MDFQGQVAFVTGAGSGMGRAIAIQFAREGARVVCADINLPAAKQTVAQLPAGAGLAIHLDVTSEESVQAAVTHAVETFGRLDILVNSAGIGPVRSWDELTLEDWNRTLAVNLTGVFLCCKAVTPIMRRQRYGRIVNISSIAGKQYSAIIGAHYGASKAGVIGLTRYLARVLAPDGILVNCVAPGTTETPFSESYIGAAREIQLKNIPLGRFARPEEIADAVLFLCSPRAAYITGETLNVNGGLLMD